VTKSKPKAKTKAKVKAKAKVSVKSKAKSKTKAKVKSKVKAKAVGKEKSKPKTKSKQKTAVKVKAKVAADAASADLKVSDNVKPKSQPKIKVEMKSVSWSLSGLLKDIVYAGRDIPDIEIRGLSLDSRNVKAGDLFFACEGHKVHGKTFIDDAIGRGASVVLWESGFVRRELRQGIPVFGIPDLKYKVGDVAERFYGKPSIRQHVIGVTGTNGKTSVSQFIAQAIHQDNKCGVIGTLGNGMFGQLKAGLHTTPDAITLHSILADLKRDGANKVVMEVSSHALDQGRAAGVAFDVAVFTNLSHEHLDYHGNMMNYGLAKRRLFESKTLKYAVINIDDDFGRALLVSMPGTVGTVSYGFESKDLLPSLMGSKLKLDKSGLSMHVESDWGKGDLRVPILGSFNGYNLLAALGALLASGIGFDDAMQRLSLVQPVDGRMEGYGGDDDCPLVVIDYAHTPDALKQALTSLREHATGKVHCVFGCGGDRDRSKRPMMAREAEQLADYIVVTDDNPRTEPSELIVADILAGFADVTAIRVIPDRDTAISKTIARADSNDVVLIAGKGHENYQLVDEYRLPFSDEDEVEKALAARRGKV
jgi:UDP-N-acetylmuramoyl-L-alanyl-D-glutamate--2,6-diaminopimelate ligase